MKLLSLAAAAVAAGASLAAAHMHHADRGMVAMHHRQHSGFMHKARSNSSSKPPSQSSSHAKNGLGWPNGGTMNIDDFSQTMGWVYSWDATPSTGNPVSDWVLPEFLNFFPMLWSNSGERIEEWQKYVLNDRHAQQNKAKVAMGPNEVNQDGQGKMSPGAACQLFRQYIMPLKHEDGWSVIGASTNGAPDGIKWMQEFKSECADVWNSIDADSLHSYQTDPNKTIEYIQQWHSTFGKPVYITETACMNFGGEAAPTEGDAYNYVKALNAFAQETDWVKGIAFYGVMKKLNIAAVNRLASTAGDPTGLFDFWIKHTEGKN